jgi:Ca2+/Na+ antiporter
MGSFLSHLFVDVSTLPDDGYGFVQLLFLGAVYGYILCYCSNMIKDGSELLLLIPAYSGIVGSIVLPVLGAVPDGAIVLFSGMGGTKEIAQEQLKVGIGALAGSTIMLLTIPWCLAIMAGRVNTDEDGKAMYHGRPKLEPTNRIMGSGVACGSSIAYSSKVMLVTLLSFVVIQGAAFGEDCGEKKDESKCATPRYAALAGAILSTLFFFFYLWDQKRMADTDEVKKDKIDQLRSTAIENNLIGLRGLFPRGMIDEDGVIQIDAQDKRFRALCRKFFKKYDVDSSGAIDKEELAMLLTDLGEKPDKDKLESLMVEMDRNNSGNIDFEEFCIAMVKLVNTGDAVMVKSCANFGDTQRQPTEVHDGEGEEEEEEESDMPEDLAHLSPEDQQKRLLRRSCLLMLVGVFFVLLFSDPMVDVLSELGARIHVSPFYVAFCLAPLASNASELIAAYSYALKKTEKTMTISFSSLVGAGCMNNTFCLSIFLFLVFGRELQWVFSAETLSILVVELIMVAIAQRRQHPTWTAFAVLSLFPISIAFVAGIEAAGLD